MFPRLFTSLGTSQRGSRVGAGAGARKVERVQHVHSTAGGLGSFFLHF